jgi:lipoate-protein ligase A
MNSLDLTLPTPAENLALDEALLDMAQVGACGEVLRFWESPQPFVVIGYANKMDAEVDVPACRRDGVAILRRCTGGGTVLQGPGCLNYSLILQIPDHGPLTSITGTNCFILDRHKIAIQPLVKGPVTVEGHSDLAVGGLKFSGNAQRRRQGHILFHGTFLWNTDLALITKYLRFPSQQPDYRANRPHSEFVTNLPCVPETIKTALRQTWRATASLDYNSSANWQELILKYSSDAWNLKS